MQENRFCSFEDLADLRILPGFSNTKSYVFTQIGGSAATRYLLRQTDLWSRFLAGLSTAMDCCEWRKTNK